jgi:hypothetical protein
LTYIFKKLSWHKINDFTMTRAPGLENPQGIDSQPNSRTMSPISKVAETPLVEHRVWNTKNLGLRLASDFVSGACAATLVAPLITVIDKLVLLFYFSSQC